MMRDGQTASFRRPALFQGADRAARRAFTSFIDERRICRCPGAAGLAVMVLELRPKPFDFEESGKLT
jgi:hypothetical protein